ncbi:DUF4238 domain-containing protein [Actinobacillus porcinus]|uniref:DUF4238 domain-containing protein n=1 Tax=Actinobacillus porcinus TaxID=51048 RepID=UPI002354A5BD|nr:DUF4238 domain-containing protein [Actinobacillus porcinus]
MNNTIEMNMTKEKILKQAIKKRHHYLPIVYSKQWVDKEGKLTIKPKNGERKQYECKPERCFFENDLNLLTFITEQQIHTIENLYKDFLESEYGSETKNFLKNLYETSKLLELATQDGLKIYIKEHNLNHFIEAGLTEPELKDINKIKQVLLSNLIEDEFSVIESNYGEFIKNLPSIIQEQKISQADIQSMLLFAILQKFRSNYFLDEKLRGIYDKDNNIPLILLAYIEYKKFILDLFNFEVYVNIAYNDSGEYILTSDSPFIASTKEFNENAQICSDYIFPISPLHLAVISKGKEVNVPDNPNKGIHICISKLICKSLIKEVNKLISTSVHNQLIIPNVT